MSRGLWKVSLWPQVEARENFRASVVDSWGCLVVMKTTWPPEGVHACDDRGSYGVASAHPATVP
eukprot:3808798-Pyramimonas_sp.AAC.1